MLYDVTRMRDDTETRAPPSETPGTDDGTTAGADTSPSQASTDGPGAIAHGTVPPIQMDRFLVLERLGSGGMGVVHAAFDPKLDRKIALKIVRADRDATPERVLAEARAMARLSHPNVVAVYDVSESGGALYIAMELVAGQNLGRWLARTPRSLAQILAVFLEAGRGLAAAHAAGLVHGDVKPANVLVGDGLVKVADFGLACAEASAVALRGGTPAYMAPELLAGSAPDVRSDQYAFAASLYEAIAGTRPLRTSATDAPAPLDAPPPIARAISRALSPDPAARFPSMTALLAALAPPPSRRPMWLAIGIAAIAIAASATVAIVRRADSDPCGGGQERALAVWSPAIRAGLPDTVAHALDDYTRSWVVMARATCEATRHGEQSEALLDLRTSCLDRRLDELSAFIAAAKRAPAAQPPGSFAAAAFALSPIEPCADRDRLAGVLPPPPAQRALVTELRARIDRARAQWDTAEYVTATADIERVVATARAAGYAPLLGEALLVQGRLLTRAGKYAQADASFKEAAAAAGEGRDDDTLTEAWVHRARVLGTELARPAEALAYAEAADAIAARASHAALQRADIRETLGQVLWRADRMPEARRALEAAVTLYEQAQGPRHPSVGNALRRLAELCALQGDLVVARGHAERARTILTAALGPDQQDVVGVLHTLANIAFGERDLPRALASYRELLVRQLATGDGTPEIAATRGNIGQMLRMLGRDDEARDEIHRALAILEHTTGLANDDAIGMLATLAKLTRDPIEARRQFEDVLARRIALVGERHSSVADATNDLGNLARDQGDLERATEYYTRALALYEAALGPGHPRVSVALSNLGEVALARGRFHDALQACTRARSIDEPKLGADHPDLAYDLACIGEAKLGLGDPRGATELLERAVFLDRQAPADDRSRARFALARALWASGGDRARAHALAETALPDAKPAARREAVAQWLRDHPTTAH